MLNMFEIVPVIYLQENPALTDILFLLSYHKNEHITEKMICSEKISDVG